MHVIRVYNRLYMQSLFADINCSSTHSSSILPGCTHFACWASYQAKQRCRKLFKSGVGWGGLGGGGGGGRGEYDARVSSRRSFFVLYYVTGINQYFWYRTECIAVT